MQPNRAGFGAIINNAINICKYHYDKFGDYDIYIDVPEINNIFETKSIPNPQDYDYDIEKDYNNSGTDNSSNAHVLCDKEKVIQKNKVYNDIFRLKNIDFFEKEKEKYITEKTLAIQIRGTDKKSEIKSPEFDAIINHTKRMLDGNNIDSIFLATDDVYYRDIMTQNFKNLVKYRDETISLDRNPIHFCEKRERWLIDKEVMADIYLLAMSNYFLYSFSNVSYLALTVGINGFKKIYCINYPPV
jgi:hypothetical protein